MAEATARQRAILTAIVESVLAKPFFEVPWKVAARTKEIAGASEEILEIR